MKFDSRGVPQCKHRARLDNFNFNALHWRCVDEAISDGVEVYKEHCSEEKKLQAHAFVEFIIVHSRNVHSRNFWSLTFVI